MRRDPAEKPYFDTLAGMRGVAAAMVVAMHLRLAHVPQAIEAVDLFFVLSGIVTERTYAGVSGAKFLRARFIRIYPLYFIGTLLGAVAGASIWGVTRYAALLPGIFFLPHLFGNPPLYPLDPPAWSLFFEALAYIGFTVIRTTPAVSVLMLLALAGVVHTHGAATLLGCTARGFFGFNLGVLMYRFRLARPLPGAWLSLALAGAVLAFPDDSLRLISITLLLPLLIFWAMHTRPGRGVRVMNAAGAASYPVYILHGPLAGMAMGLPLHMWRSLTELGFAALILVLYAFRRVLPHPFLWRGVAAQ